MIAIAAPIIGDEETRAVNEVLASGRLAQGPKVAELEADFAAYCGTKYAVAVNSGTAAIHAALYAAGVGEGDEVVTTSFSFMATINPILMLGARPVLVDIDPVTFNLDAAAVERAITDKTKVIMPVHLYGQPADMDELQRIAKERNLRIVEDACQAIGAEYQAKKAGSLGDAGCFSLYATKNIMCGEGGMVTTDDPAVAAAIRQFRQHGMTDQYEYAGVGYNYRMSDLHAAIAIEQLRKADHFTSLRQRNAKLFSAELSDYGGLELPTVFDDRTHVYHQYTVRLKPGIDRQKLLEELRRRDVIAGVYYHKPLHAYPHVAELGYRMGDLPQAERAANEVLSLPVHPMVTEDDVAYIAQTLKESIDGQ